MITKEINLGKVAPVGKREYDKEISYDVLDIVSYHGQSYMSLHEGNKGNDPSTDSEETHWMLLAERGESWYQMCVRTGRYSGTEEEFLNEKQRQIDDAAKAAKAANEAAGLASSQAANAKTQADRARDIAVLTEELYALVEQENSSWMAKEQARENAELARVQAEKQRAQAEAERDSSESIRKSNESVRIANEEGRASAESTRATEEATRKANETTRKVSESERVKNEKARAQAEQLREQSKSECVQATQDANEAAENANDTANHPTYIGPDYYVYQWDKGTHSYTKTTIFTRGKNFSVYKTYESIAAMQADLSNVMEGEFVLISNDNMEDPDNAKLYVRTSSGFNYLVDMSGAKGFTGKTPQISVGSVTAGNSLTDISVSLSPNGTDADGNPCFLLNVKIPALNWVDLTEEQKDELRTPLAVELDGLRTKVDRLEMYHSTKRYAVAAWDNNDLNPVATEQQGDKRVADDYKFVLIDTTDNARTTTGWKELTRNNLLRFKDGTFAPTVGITQSMQDECMSHALYSLGEDGSTFTEEYATGAYDAAAEWEIDKALIQSGGGPRPLYARSDDGSTYAQVSHKLRPWETVETKYTIGLGMDHDVYLLDNVTGESGKSWQGLFLDPVTWDGIDMSPFRLAPTAIAPGPVCTVGGKTRSFFYLYEGETNCKGASNLGCTMFNEGRTYPRVSDMQQVNNMNFARANNADNTLPYPFAEGGYHALNTYNVALEVLYGSRYIHSAARFGTGISSLDSCSNEATWLQNGGLRAKPQGSGDWAYSTWGARNACVYQEADGKTKLVATTVNSEYPKEQCMESQMAFSYAMEIGVAEGVEFDFYGGRYWYKAVADTTGVAKMNVRVYRIKTGTIEAYNANGEPATFDVEACLRMSLYGGANLSGDVYAYWGGGYEQVGTCLDPTRESLHNPVRLYLQPDQLRWERETSTAKDDLGEFGFERSYLFVGATENLGNSYAKCRAPYTGWKTANGGGTGNGMCYFQYDYNYWSTKVRQRVRLAARFRVNASASYCSRRSLNASYPASFTFRYYAGSAQALIEAAGPLQAE